MRLSPFHMQLAKEFAVGKRNMDILQDYPISESRLSVIKANPLFIKEIERQRRILDDKYGKAVSVLEEAAEKVATRLVEIVEDKSLSADVRSKTAENILNRVAAKTGNVAGAGNELVFEQMLRVTKRSIGDTDDTTEQTFDAEEAYKQLMEDIQPPPPEPGVNVTQTITIPPGDIK